MTPDVLAAVVLAALITVWALSRARSSRAKPEPQVTRAGTAQRGRPVMPRWLSDGSMDGVPVGMIARRYGLTLRAAGRFRDSWNEASRHEHKPRGDRAQIELGDITDDPGNWKQW